MANGLTVSEKFSSLTQQTVFLVLGADCTKNLLYIRLYFRNYLPDQLKNFEKYAQIYMEIKFDFLKLTGGYIIYMSDYEGS